MKRSVKGRFRAVDDANSEGSVGSSFTVYTVNICYTIADRANNFLTMHAISQLANSIAIAI